jgi:hypothetical protein
MCGPMVGEVVGSNPSPLRFLSEFVFCQPARGTRPSDGGTGLSARGTRPSGGGIGLSARGTRPLVVGPVCQVVGPACQRVGPARQVGDWPIARVGPGLSALWPKPNSTFHRHKYISCGFLSPMKCIPGGLVPSFGPRGGGRGFEFHRRSFLFQIFLAVPVPRGPHIIHIKRIQSSGLTCQLGK